MRTLRERQARLDEFRRCFNKERPGDDGANRYDSGSAFGALARTSPTIPPHRFAAVDKAFGQWEASNFNTILCAIDNEIHHRGQGYVYLRALGIEPPAFYDRT
jgi:hypothetical protein